MAGVREVWVTGIGLATSLGEGVEWHGKLLAAASSIVPNLDTKTYAPYLVHRLADIDLGTQIPSRSDRRQMGRWQQIGVHAAGLALEDAGVAGVADLLDRMHLIVAAGNGERDEKLDQHVLETCAGSVAAAACLNESLAGGLRPTLYLGELSNLLAGNIQIVLKVTGSSRTFKGEEIAGVTAIENAVRRIAAGQGDLFLVGGALNAERNDLLLGCALGGNLWAHPHCPVWQRATAGGGFMPGSAGAFLVLEEQHHAQARGARPYARIRAIASDRSRRSEPGDIGLCLSKNFDSIGSDIALGPLAVLSGASGCEPATSEERTFLDRLDARGYEPRIRAYGTGFGHAVEAHFPLGVALAALAVGQKALYPPFDQAGDERGFEGRCDRVLVTGVGHWRGEGLALLEPADERVA